jgi:phosphatidate cytidylyltransferase
MLLAAQLPELSAVLPPQRALILGVALAVATQVGDLFESAFKRSMNVKDSGALLPAFGGMLDLIDSFIFAAPLGYTLAGAWIN